MKRVLAFAALAATLGAVAPAMAADLIIEQPVAVLPDVPAGFDWTGAYIGARVGWAAGQETDNLEPFDVTIILIDNADSFDLDGWLGGVYAGYNVQMDGVVFGIEAGIDGADISGEDDFAYEFGPTGTLSLRSDWQAHLRGRLGVALDRALIYATAGIVGANATLTATVDGAPATEYSDTNVHTGWTVGAGVEYAISDNLIGRLAVDYGAFGDQTYELGGPFMPTESSWTQTTVSAGLSFKF